MELLDAVAHAINLSTLEVEEAEFKVSLVHIVSSRTAEAMLRLSQKTKNR